MKLDKPILLCGGKRCCPTLHSTGKKARVTDDFGNDVTMSSDEWIGAIDDITQGDDESTVSFGGVTMFRSQAAALKSNLA
jgi:hypothetical protein